MDSDSEQGVAVMLLEKLQLSLEAKIGADNQRFVLSLVEKLSQKPFVATALIHEEANLVHDLAPRPIRMEFCGFVLHASFADEAM